MSLRGSRRHGDGTALGTEDPLDGVVPLDFVAAHRHPIPTKELDVLPRPLVVMVVNAVIEPVRQFVEQDVLLILFRRLRAARHHDTATVIAVTGRERAIGRVAPVKLGRPIAAHIAYDSLDPCRGPLAPQRLESCRLLRTFRR